MFEERINHLFERVIKRFEAKYAQTYFNESKYNDYNESIHQNRKSNFGNIVNKCIFLLLKFLIMHYLMRVCKIFGFNTPFEMIFFNVIFLGICFSLEERKSFDDCCLILISILILLIVLESLDR
jgi:hypothetical protein